MHKVVVKKDEALVILRKNREAHRGIFLEAVDGYKKQAVQMLEKHIDNIKKGKVARVSVSLPQPADYTKEYDRVIKMLEMSIDDTVELDDVAFGQYIMDDWNWKLQFLTSNSAYSGTASAYLAQESE